MPAILLIRHAQASFGTENYDLLSARGRRQAEVLGAALAGRGLLADLVVSGDLRRQTETAAAIPRAEGAELAVDPDWNEYDTDPILLAHSPVSVRLEEPVADGGERIGTAEFQRLLDDALAGWVRSGAGSPCDLAFPDFSRRVGGALDAAFDRLGPGQTGVVVSSGGAIAAACAALLGAPGDAFVPLARVQVNTGVTKLVRGAAAPSLLTFNDHAHLEDADRALVTYR